MNIDKQWLQHLQRLSRLYIEDESKFIHTLNSVISYLEGIGENSFIDKESIPNHQLYTVDTVTPAGEKKLLQNTNHEILNNSIVIQSVLRK